MAIVGSRPDSGLRIDLERPIRGGPPWRYRGEAATPEDGFSIAATVSAEGEVEVDVAPGAPADLGERVHRVVRSAWKHAQEDGLPPPRRIQRWRADR
jgi:hypothetical protein